MASSEAQARAAGELAGKVFADLGLELHPDKTKVVDLREGREGFDFLGCHFRARVSGRLLGKRRPPLLLAALARAGGDEACPSEDQGQDRPCSCRAGHPLRDRGAQPDPARLGNYFRTGNAARKFNQIDRYVVPRLGGLMRKRYGRGCRGPSVYRWRFDVDADSPVSAVETARDFLDDAWASCKVRPRPEGLVDFDVVIGEERWELLTGE